MKKEKGKEKEGGWVEASNPWKMWWVKCAVRRNYCQLLEGKDRQWTLRACLLLKQTGNKMPNEFDCLSLAGYIPTSPSNALCTMLPSTRISDERRIRIYLYDRVSVGGFEQSKPHTPHNHGLYSVSTRMMITIFVIRTCASLSHKYFRLQRKCRSCNSVEYE